MRTLLVGLAGSLVALVGFATTANAAATIDLQWAGGLSNTTLLTSSSAQLNVILTNDVANIGASVSVDFSSTVGKYGVTFTNNPNGAVGNVLPLALGPAADIGGIIESFNAGALPPYVGSGLAAGQSWLLGTITFHKSGPGASGAFSIDAVLGVNDSVNNGAGGSLPASQITLGSATLTNVPEPGTVSLLALGLAGLALAGHRKN